MSTLLNEKPKNYEGRRKDLIGATETVFHNPSSLEEVCSQISSLIRMEVVECERHLSKEQHVVLEEYTQHVEDVLEQCKGEFVLYEQGSATQILEAETRMLKAMKNKVLSVIEDWPVF